MIIFRFCIFNFEIGVFFLFLQISALSQRIDRVFNEQQIVLRAFETDTARALSTADARSRGFVDELRSQIFQSKSQEHSERERTEQRINQKIDDAKRLLEKYVKYTSKESNLKYIFLLIYPGTI